MGVYVSDPDPKRKLTRDEVNKFRPVNVDDHRIHGDDPLVANDICSTNNYSDPVGVNIWNPPPDAKRYPLYLTQDEMWMFRRLLDQEKDSVMACALRNLKDQITTIYADWKAKGILPSAANQQQQQQ